MPPVTAKPGLYMATATKFLQPPRIPGILKDCCLAAFNKIEQESNPMPKRTFQPNRRHRAKTHGFLTRMKTKAGAAVLSRRRAKGRHKIAVSAGFRD